MTRIPNVRPSLSTIPMPTILRPFRRLAWRIHRSLIAHFLFFLLALSHAQADENSKPIYHGGVPPQMVRRAAYAEALKIREQVPVDEGNHLHDHPILLSAQRTVDFRHPSRPAWLLLYSVGEWGPRAHTNISQLTLLSAGDGRVLWKSPQSLQGGDDSAPSEMDDAVMVEIAPGRFVLGLSCGSGGRWGGSATILALGGPKPLESLLDLPGEKDGPYTESTGYFVSTGAHEPLALAVRQEEITFGNDADPLDPTLTRREFLFRFDSKLERLEKAAYPIAQLTRLIDSAARNKITPQIYQSGSLAFGANAYEVDQLAAADRALNRAYEQLRQKLPPDEKEQLKREELAWLGRRDALKFSERTPFVQNRTKELRQRLGQQPSAKPRAAP